MSVLPLAQWRDFYVMIGTASGAVVGATFVVATLASNVEQRAVGMRGFITPTAVHLGSVLLGSAVLCVPTLTPLALTILLAAGGSAGAIYGVVVGTRIWHLELDLSDRAFYVILPILCYVGVTAAALMVRQAGTFTFEMLATALVLLFVIGMRNAWDMANFMITRDRSG